MTHVSFYFVGGGCSLPLQAYDLISISRSYIHELRNEYNLKASREMSKSDGVKNNSGQPSVTIVRVVGAPKDEAYAKAHNHPPSSTTRHASSSSPPTSSSSSQQHRNHQHLYQQQAAPK